MNNLVASAQHHRYVFADNKVRVPPHLRDVPKLLSEIEPVLKPFDSPGQSDLVAESRDLLGLDDYPCQIRMPIRWNDVGGDGVVSHVSLARYIEDARVALISQVMSHSPVKQHALRVFVARFSLEQHADIRYPQELVLGAGVSRLGSSSYAIDIAIFLEGRCIGRSETVNVAVDDRSHPTPIPDDHRSFLLAEQVTATPPATAASKPSDERFQAERYKHSCEFETRFSDTDRLGHINNVAIVRYYDDALAQLFSGYYPQGKGLSVGWMGKTLRADVSFSGESHHSFPLRVSTGVTALDGDVLHLEQALFQGGDCVGVRDLTLAMPEMPTSFQENLKTLQIKV